MPGKKFEPFLAAALRSRSPGGIFLKRAIQTSLFPEDQTALSFALRLHRTTAVRFDFRLQVLNTLFSLVLDEPPSLDPAKSVRAKLMDDHEPSYLFSEFVIPEGQEGAGPTMPVDMGQYIPIMRKHETYETEMLDQLAEGDFRFVLRGEQLKGGWLLTGRRNSWELRKLEDEYASTSEVLRLDRSVRSGMSLDELEATFFDRKLERESGM